MLKRVYKIISGISCHKKVKIQIEPQKNQFRTVIIHVINALWSIDLLKL